MIETCSESSGSFSKKGGVFELMSRKSPSWIGFQGFGALFITWQVMICRMNYVTPHYHNVILFWLKLFDKYLRVKGA